MHDVIANVTEGFSHTHINAICVQHTIFCTLQSEVNTTMATVHQLFLAKLVLIVALFVVLQTCQAQQGYASLFIQCVH